MLRTLVSEREHNLGERSEEGRERKKRIMRGLCVVFLRGGAGEMWVCLVGGGVSERLEHQK